MGGRILSKRIFAAIFAFIMVLTFICTPAVTFASGDLLTDDDPAVTHIETSEPDDGSNEAGTDSCDEAGQEIDGFSLGGGGFGSIPENEIFSSFIDLPWQENTFYLEINGDPRDLPLPETATVLVDNPYREEFHAIVWDYESFDSSFAGERQIYGYIDVPEGYNLWVWDAGDPDAARRVFSYIVVHEPEVPQVVSKVQINLNSHDVPLGIDGDDLADYLEWILLPDHENVTVMTECGAVYGNGKVIGFDISLVDTATVGTYYPFTILLPFGVVSAEDGDTIQVIEGAEVHVVDFGKPQDDELYLLGEAFGPVFGNIFSDWSKIVLLPRLWMSDDEGETWRRVYDGFFDNPGPGDIVIYHSFNPNTANGILELQISYNDLIDLGTGKVYEFEIRYLGGGISRDSLVVDLTGDDPEYRSRGIDRRSGDKRDQFPPGGSDGGGSNGSGSDSIGNGSSERSGSSGQDNSDLLTNDHPNVPYSQMDDTPVTIPDNEIPLGDLPLDELPLGDLPLDDLPLGDLPLGDLPLDELPATAPVAALPRDHPATLQSDHPAAQHEYMALHETSTGRAAGAQIHDPSAETRSIAPPAQMPGSGIEGAAEMIPAIITGPISSGSEPSSGSVMPIVIPAVVGLASMAAYIGMFRTRRTRVR
jgi:hypothetical protein